MKHFLFILFILVSGYAGAQSNQIFSTDGVAIRGYDPVAYFTDNKPVEGSKNFSWSWQGTAWQFKDQANLEAFKSNPEKYAPQFGGYCAYGVSEDHKSPTQPDAFTIVNNKLYLNYNVKVKELWVKDIPGRVAKAEAHWPELKDKKE